ncbi:hypothetical protein FG93_00619 [Bosea sp. LC85]|nr:hypothetical protein FG93_00619 [Bosea sp. LC85]
MGSSSTAPMQLPQAGQKARLEWSDERKSDGAPPGPVQVIAPLGNSTQATVNAPVWRWHMVQEHVCGFSAGPLASKRTEPQRHPPD